MPAIPRLAALATAVPRHRLAQHEVVAQAKRAFAGAPHLERLLPVFVTSGVAQRFSAVPLDWFAAPHGWAERSRRYVETALPLLEAAVGRALDDAGVPLAEIGAVVAVSTTGVATPSLDALLIERLRLPPTVQRLPVFGLGCAGGALGLARAASLAAAMPNKAVLLLVVELCSLTFRLGDNSNSNIVGAALFGDGAAAAVLHCGRPGPAIVAGGEHTWPETLDLMGWEVMEDGLKPVFSQEIPRLAAAELGAAARGFLAERGLSLGDVDRFLCHPGGPKVIAACEGALGLLPGTLFDARTVLREFGNMSAASVLFVLDRLLVGGAPWRRALLTAFGPGFTAGFVVLENS
ncbi:MAG TPA: 3-oxoacyl-[acyl-carrier-protein] synthase III C-terminal domain-containing protein [Stellaceae bacterium]|nr:3-oxoacyl-[acyl-carrier-protein] synthase III C-terminal domain-containing protein [Stellaceae bacterium]